MSKVLKSTPSEDNAGEDSNMPIPLKSIPCQELLILEKVSCKGNLRRRKTLHKVIGQVINSIQWSRNYVILMNGCLYCYTHETDSSPSKSWSLYSFTDVEECANELGPSILWPFKIVHAFDESNNIYFSAAVECDFKKWIKAFKEEIYYANHMNTNKSTSQKAASQTIGRKPSSTSLPPSLPPFPFKEDLHDYMDGSKISNNENIELPPPLKSRVLPKPAKSKVPLPKIPKEASSRTPKKNAIARSTSQDEQEDLLLYEPVSTMITNLKKNSNENNKSKNMITLAYWDGDPKEAESVLSATPIGTFMIRKSFNPDSKKTLLVRVENPASLAKYKIFELESGLTFIEDNGDKFDGLTSLLKHYSENNLPRRKEKLTKPYSDFL